MSRWTAITELAVKTGKNTAVLTAVRAKATANGDADPLAEYITDVVATLRTAVQSGNQVDSDATKVPNGLKEMALRMILRRLYSYIELALSTDDAKQAEEDRSYLNRIIDKRLRFPAPDTADATQPLPNLGNWDSENKLIMRTHPVPRPRTQFDPQTNTYANPDAPADRGNDA